MAGIFRNCYMFVLTTTLFLHVHSQRNPSILQDSRDLPTPEGYFGFLYRTEDGISHGARGDPSGTVHGRFTYTDPTGLKVNFNYNAGTRSSPSNDRYREPNPEADREYQQPDLPPSRPLAVAAGAQQRAPSSPSRAAPRAPAPAIAAPAPVRAAPAPVDDYYSRSRDRPAGRNVEYYDQPRTPAEGRSVDYYDQPGDYQEFDRHNDLRY